MDVIEQKYRYGSLLTQYDLHCLCSNILLNAARWGQYTYLQLIWQQDLTGVEIHYQWSPYNFLILLQRCESFSLFYIYAGCV